MRRVLGVVHKFLEDFRKALITVELTGGSGSGLHPLIKSCSVAAGPTPPSQGAVTALDNQLEAPGSATASSR